MNGSFSMKCLASLAACVLVSGTAAAQPSFPRKPIELVVPYPAGGGTDVLARAFAQAATKHIPQPVVVLNKPGASGAIGWSETLRSPADGYKVVLLATDLMTQPNMGFTQITYADFTPIARLNYDPAALTVRADAPWNSLEAFTQAAKKESLTIGNGGDGGAWHLAAAALEGQSGAKIVHVPFAGAGPAALALLGGHIDAVTVSAAEVSVYLESGKLKLIGMMADQRVPEFAATPTFKEQGMDIQIGAFRGLAVPKATPPEVVAYLAEATSKIAQEPEFRQALTRQRMGYAFATGPEFMQAMARDNKLYADLIEKVGLKKQ